MTKVINSIDDKDFYLAVKDIQNNELVIFPTETVYGIGANALSFDAVEKIFEVKERARNNPLIVHLANTKDISKYADTPNEIEQKLINAFMPGPFTLILKKKDLIPSNVTANLDTVGIRVPANEIAIKFINASGIPIAAPSANLSSRPSGTMIDDIKDEFNNKVSYIIDGGHTSIGLESTVVKVIDGVPNILRPGFITKKDIEEVVGCCYVSEHVLKETNGVVESPGMLYKHYAPKTKCVLLYSESLNTLKDLINEYQTKKTVILGSDHLKDISTYKFIDYGNSLEEIAHNLFSKIRECDRIDADLIIMEGVKQEGLGLAIMNRLVRACSFNYIEK